MAYNSDKFFYNGRTEFSYSSNYLGMGRCAASNDISYFILWLTPN
jgi:hypothetical protein